MAVRIPGISLTRKKLAHKKMGNNIFNGRKKKKNFLNARNNPKKNNDTPITSDSVEQTKEYMLPAIIEESGTAETALNKAVEQTKEYMLPAIIEESGTAETALNKAKADAFEDIFNGLRDEKGKLGRADQQMYNRLSKEKKFFDNMSDKDWEKYTAKNNTTKEDVYRSINEKAKAGPSMGDYFYGYHGPTAVGTGLAGAALFSLMNSRGQKSNAELYSDPFA